jgi:hypothetical protein
LTTKISASETDEKLPKPFTTIKQKIRQRGGYFENQKGVFLQLQRLN